MSDFLNDIDFVNIATIAMKIVLVLLVYLIISPIGKKLIQRSLYKAGNNQKLTEARAKTLEKLMINIYSYVLGFILIATIFGLLSIDLAPLIAGAGIIGLAIGFGAQGLVSDVVTGFFLLLEKQVEVDEYVTAGGMNGVVEEIGLRTTKIRSFDGTLNFVPNRHISTVSNHSRGNMRALVDIGIAYDENIDEAMVVLQKVCDEFAQNDERFKDGPNVLGVQSLGSSDVVLRVLGQTENMQQWAVERDLRKRMKEALDEAGIEIPFPHQVYIEKKES
ncbi:MULTISPECIES: mechanosensitive ion channel family protein [Pontibacillus]|uniref:Mechanosensitive ion channel family protein n=1 Tax=Pontibacillus chungwhensis TaxID=265426 RepID=A0ABY8V7F9_9BACI|nr:MULTISPECIES: mechanosensitive ion channel family protein [Pontibacillus]MCD5322506.1 mechanosensitive ion channel family protein [Pontibacillus sp. HN14]WIF99791.1 mechanosensitive ion channel family protein [Pontibacillus chungwhensis]